MKVKTKESILAVALLVAIGAVFAVAGPFDEMFSSAGKTALNAYDSTKTTVVEIVDKAFTDEDDAVQPAGHANGEDAPFGGVAKPLVSDDPEVMASAAAMEGS